LAGEDGDSEDFTVCDFGLWVVAMVEYVEQVVRMQKVAMIVSSMVDLRVRGGIVPAHAGRLDKVASWVRFFSRGQDCGRDARVPSAARTGSASVSLTWK
jgi:hypothetical protein